MPVYFLGALTLLILVIAVWAMLVDDEDGMEVEQYEPKWEPLTEEPGYRKAS